MINFFQKMRHRKFLSAVILIVLIAIGYYVYNNYADNKTTTRYVTSAAEKGTLVVSISGNGQVSASSQVDVKSKNSGTVMYVDVKEGQTVKAGALLAQIDSADAQKTVRDAQSNLEASKISMAKLKQPATELSILQAQTALDQANLAKTTATDDLAKSYEDGFTSVADAFLSLPDVMSGLNDILLGNAYAATQWNIDYYTNAALPYEITVTQYRQSAYNDYQAARTSYNKVFADYKAITRSADNTAIEKLIAETYDSSSLVSEAIKSANNLIQFYKDTLIAQNFRPSATADAHLATLSLDTGKVNSILSDLFNIRKTFQTDKAAIVNADSSIAEKTLSLANLKAGADPLDIQSQQLSLTQKENALIDARQKLADYYVRAPFDGVVASVSVSKGDTVVGSGTVATMITKQSLAEIPLNEVDIAKVKVGQKTTFTFDAVPDLTIAGTVSSVDLIGTVTQGVVNYNVKIIFDTQNDSVKPGMSTTAAIITDVKQDAIFVPNSAVKTSGSSKYVQILENSKPVNKTVEIGLANDTDTEIVSGLSEGDNVITQTITSTASASATSGKTTTGSGSAVRIPGIGGGFGR